MACTRKTLTVSEIDSLIISLLREENLESQKTKDLQKDLDGLTKQIRIMDDQIFIIRKKIRDLYSDMETALQIKEETVEKLKLCQSALANDILMTAREVQHGRVGQKHDA